MDVRGGIRPERFGLETWGWRVLALAVAGATGLVAGWSLVGSVLAGVAIGVLAIVAALRPVLTSIPARLGLMADRYELFRLDRATYATRDPVPWVSPSERNDRFWQAHARYATRVAARDPAEAERLLRAGLVAGSVAALVPLIEFLERHGRAAEVPTLLTVLARTQRFGLLPKARDALVGAGRSAEAMAFYRASDSSGALRFLAALHREAGDVDTALATWRASLAARNVPDSADDAKLAEALSRAGRFDEAEEVLLRHPYALVDQRAALLVATGRAAQMERDLRAKLDAGPDADARRLLRALLWATGRGEEAGQYRDPAPAPRPDPPADEPIDTWSEIVF